MGLHFDFHAMPYPGAEPIGKNLTEENIREICTLLRPDYLQIDCKGHPGWASYPSKFKNAMPEFEQSEPVNGDPLALWRKITREEDVALYMHYSGVIDERYCKENPEQAVLNADVIAEVCGKDGRQPLASVIPYGKGKIACIGAELGGFHSYCGQYLETSIMQEIFSRLYVPSVRCSGRDRRLSRNSRFCFC